MPRHTPVVLWLAGTALSLAGTQAMGFALVWSAAARSAPLAALTLTAIIVPRVLFLLPGGALSDRLGAWRVLVGADIAAAVATLTCALLLTVFPSSPWLIPLVALSSGIADAVYLPASATVPRLLTDESGSLSRTMAARQIAGQSAALAGPALGGLLVTAVGLAPVVAANGLTFAAMAIVLIRLRPHLTTTGRPDRVMSATGHAGTGPAVDPPAAGPTAGESSHADPPGSGAGTGRSRTALADAVRGTAAGLRIVLVDPVLRPALALTAAAAAFLLPVSSLLLPLLARERHWPGSHTGLLAAALAAGTGGIALIVLLRGALPRPGLVAAAGLLTAAAGTAALALGDRLPFGGRPAAGACALLPAAAAALVVGVGSGVFATHVGPLFLGRAPRSHLARTQSVLVLAQSLPLLATQNLFGAASAPVGVPPLLLICGLALALASGLAWRSRPLRDA
ncbi:MFS transporter [Catenuloplanes japonicus]|uniref:MFS transporter n=1 Tax=Catenuloplanes japonicus TaxID=33876 RepID=UPI001E2B83CA|nr:MFS transporter [Catenuloplanes japonicus]